eukprot:GEMP01004134.1.p1 GENE.GEMP01004134.1~~GEMP01004134.1.p1  ORF type:complete len:996 (+),score=206.51 GEMP01004134.1:43-3030(+)
MATGPPSQFKNGDIVLANGKVATVKFVGPTKFSSGTWIGVEFQNHKTGKNDGTVDGVTYFGPCEMGFGLFLKEGTSNLQKYTPEKAAAIMIQSKARSIHDRQKTEMDAGRNLWTLMEEAEEKEYHQENQTVAGVESYMIRNFPQQKQGVMSTGRRPSAGAETSINPAMRQKSRLDDRESVKLASSWKAELGFSFDLSSLTEQSVHQLFDRIKRRPDDRLPLALVWAMVCAIENLYTNLYTTSLVRRNPPAGGRMVLVGDTHGQLEDVLWIFFKYEKPSAKNSYFFNGDIADRGVYSMEILIILWAFQLWNPDCIHINRGNHEDTNMNERDRSIGGGFAQECRGKYGPQVYQKIQQIFDIMPLASVVADKLLVIHGGLFRSPGVTVQHINKIQRQRPCPSHPHTVSDWIFFDALWSDPTESRGKGMSRRGDDCFCFGPDVTSRFLKQNKLDMIVRSHEVPHDARGFQVHHDGRLLTIFSASNYCGTGGNYGGVMILQPTLEFEIFEHWAPDLQELVELEEETQLATAAVQQSLTAIAKKEEEVRWSKRRSSILAVRSEVAEKLRVKVAEYKDDLWWVCDNAQDVFMHNNKKLIPLDTFRQALADVIGPVFPWVEITQKQLGLRLADEKRKGVDYAGFLKRFRVELEGINAVAWQREAVAKVFTAILRADLPLRQLFALFDRNLSGAVSFSEFVSVIENFDLGLTPRQLDIFYRTIASQSIAGDETKDGDGPPEDAIYIADFLARFDVAFRLGGRGAGADKLKDWMKPVITAISRAIINATDREGTAPCRILSYFEDADKTGTGVLTPDEFVKSIKSLVRLEYELRQANACKLDDAKLQELARFVDITGSGNITYVEFIHAFGSWAHEGKPLGLMEDVLDSVTMVLYKNRRALRKALQYFDQDGIDMVTPAQFMHSLNGLAAALAKPDPPFTPAQIDSLVKAMDFDQVVDGKKGYINYNKFLDSFVVVDLEHEKAADGVVTVWRKRCSTIGGGRLTR